jgi:ankyrin repeat protein
MFTTCSPRSASAFFDACKGWRVAHAQPDGARLRDGATPFFVAAEIGNLALVQLLAKQLGADVTQAAIDGVTPFYIAVQMDHLAVVRYLVKELGADVSQGANNGATPLYLAA